MFIFSYSDKIQEQKVTLALMLRNEIHTLFHHPCEGIKPISRHLQYKIEKVIQLPLYSYDLNKLDVHTQTAEKQKKILLRYHQSQNINLLSL